MDGLFPELKPRPTDIFVAIMGMTGTGKSTFISLCTGEDVLVGHSLESCTQNIGIYQCRWSSDVDIYLVDTPGFDDTTRSDTDVLKDIATWLTNSYQKDLKLSGIMYLHRITDHRMVGSAKKNLFMFKKLCGSGATVKQHNNSRDSAMRLLKTFVTKNRVTMSIQQEMVNDGKALDQTQAGMELDSELLRERDKFRKERAEAEEMMRQAMEARDQQSAEMLRQHKDDMQLKIDQVIKDREQRKVSMMRMHEEKFAELKERYKEQQDKLRETEGRIKKTLQGHQQQEQKMKNDLKLLRQQVEEQAFSKPVQKMQPLFTTGSKAPRPPKPGRSCMKEHMRLTLSGSNYCFIGPTCTVGNRPEDMDKLYWRVDEIQYATFGMNGSWYFHYSDPIDGEASAIWSDSLKKHYPGLWSWLMEQRPLECPAQLSLGVNGNYFVGTKGGVMQYQLPQTILDQGGSFEDVERIWLGADDAYVMEKAGNELVWDLKGHYGKLGPAIDKSSSKTKDLALNLEDPTSFLFLSDGAGYTFNTGDKHRLSPFREFNHKNCGAQKAQGAREFRERRQGQTGYY
ncbi:Fc.00g106920.m01.CDS01 [Cosmosporella sp. VM-42]